MYLDTSALGRVLLSQPEAPLIRSVLGEFDRRVSNRLLQVELRRLALREAKLDTADALLDGVTLLSLNDAVLSAAESVRPVNVGTLDAIHLVTAMRLATRPGLDAMMTYDRRLAAAAAEHGLEVLSPS